MTDPRTAAERVMDTIRQGTERETADAAFALSLRAEYMRAASVSLEKMPRGLMQ